MKSVSLGISVLFGAALASQATVISYEALALANWAPIPDTYGSTADVSVTYRSIRPDNVVDATHLLYWGTGYAEMPAAAFQTVSGYYGEVTLTPAPGKSVTLNSFRMAAYPTATAGLRAEGTLTVSSGATSIAYGPLDLSQAISTLFSPGLTSSSPITIYFGTDYNNGINYIDFDSQTAGVVPEPSTYVAGLLATLPLGGLAVRSLRKRRTA